MPKWRSEDFGGTPGRKKTKPKLTQKEIEQHYRERYQNVHVKLRRDVAGALRLYAEAHGITITKAVEKAVYETVTRPAYKEQFGIDVPYEQSPFGIDYAKVPKSRNKYLEEWDELNNG